MNRKPFRRKIHCLSAARLCVDRLGCLETKAAVADLDDLRLSRSNDRGIGMAGSLARPSAEVQRWRVGPIAKSRLEHGKERIGVERLDEIHHAERGGICLKHGVERTVGDQRDDVRELVASAEDEM